MSNSVITLQLNEEQENMLLKQFHENKTPAPAYARWQVRPEGCVITCYASGKTVFQGRDAGIYASAFQKPEGAAPQVQVSSGDILPQAGSDEVGTGDFFGPVCVAAAIIDSSTISEVRKLGVRDSKALDDDDIRRIAPSLLRLLPHSVLILDNARYNAVHETNNINAIKAKLHNQAYVNLEKKYGLPSFCMIDQFTPEKSYYRYIRGEQRIIRGIHFETKAENRYPSVGAASILARYAFLIRWDEMEKRYGMKLCKGAGPAVDRCAAEFVGRFGFDELKNAAKLHFRNTEKLQKHR